MARSRVAYKSVSVFCALILLFLLAPLFLENNPRTAPIATALTWTGAKFTQGFVSLFAISIVFAVSNLVNHVRSWMTGQPVSSVSAEDEEELSHILSQAELGSAPTIPEQQHADDQAEASKPTPADDDGAFSVLNTRSYIETPTLTHSPLRAVTMLIFGVLVLGSQLVSEDIVSLDKSVFQNILDASVYVVRGFEVVFVSILLLLTASYCKTGGVGRSRRSRVSASVTHVNVAEEMAIQEVLFDEASLDAPVAEQIVVGPAVESKVLNS